MRSEIEPHPSQSGRFNCVAFTSDKQTSVVGESFHEKHLVKMLNKHLIEDRVAYTWAVLVPDPKNKFDPNAVAVEIESKKAGHLSRKTASYLQGHLLAMESQAGYRVCCPAAILESLEGHVGVSLEIDTEEIPNATAAIINQVKSGRIKSMESTNLIPCSECGQTISKTAYSCPSCGAALRVKSSSNGLAAVLSFFIPGLGQLYQGRFLAAAFLFIGFWLTIWILVGIIFWIIAIIDALAYKPKP